MTTRFLTLFIGRTGSSYLMDMLHHHPWITALGEELGPDAGLNLDAQNAWLDRYASARAPFRLALGFKAKLWDVLDQAHLREVIAMRGIRVIRLTRRNTLRAAISTIRSHELHARTGDWNATSAQERPAPSTIDLEQLDEILRGREREHTRLASFIGDLRTPVLELAYEDLLRDRAGTLARVGRFLRVPVFGVLASRTRYVKNTPAEWHESVANLDELRRHVEGTRYESMMHEP